MSNGWHGGKGDKSRISDYKSYSDNYDFIFRREKNDRQKLYCFLDDIRYPKDAILWGESPPIKLVDKSGINNWQWDIVRSYDEFVEYIEDHGIPDVVSFDNDLIDVMDTSDEEIVSYYTMEGWRDFKIKTGLHCAEYLANACKQKQVPIPTYYIHTANSMVRPMIDELLKNANIEFHNADVKGTIMENDDYCNDCPNPAGCYAMGKCSMPDAKEKAEDRLALTPCSESCPQCNATQGFWPADFVDNGVGMEKCSPAHCDACGWQEPSFMDIFNSPNNEL